jgi:hypothetical protein
MTDAPYKWVARIYEDDDESPPMPPYSVEPHMLAAWLADHILQRATDGVATTPRNVVNWLIEQGVDRVMLNALTDHLRKGHRPMNLSPALVKAVTSEVTLSLQEVHDKLPAALPIQSNKLLDAIAMLRALVQLCDTCKAHDYDENGPGILLQ